MWRDISERRAAEARLAESHRLASLGMLASGFSHELNTPLATVLMCVEGILRESRRRRDAARRNGRRSRSARRSRASSSCAAAASRSTSCGCRAGRPSSADIVDLQATLSAVARLIEPTARAHAVRIVLPAAFAGLHVRADEAELQHVIINLLLNAIQASQPERQVSVELAAAIRCAFA